MPIIWMGDELVFSTGRHAYCHDRIIGINDRGQITGGFDGELTITETRGDGSLYEIGPLTLHELTELVEHMIQQWQKIKTNNC